MNSGGTLVDRAMARVRDHIREHKLRAGDTLPGEAHFAAELEVSRAVMREAFGALAALRQIDVANGRRARVGAIDGSVIASSLDHAVLTAQISVADVWEVRRTLELRTAALAAFNRSDAEAQALLTAAAGMATVAEDMAALSRFDIAFHQRIAQASGNPLFLQIVRSFERLMKTAVPRAWMTLEAAQDRAVMLDQHSIIAQAIADRDPSAASTAMERHFDDTVGQLLMSAPPASLTPVAANLDQADP